MTMQTWSGEPAAYRLMAIFVGDRGALDEFLNVWLLWAGGLELMHAPVHLHPALAGGSEATAEAITIARVPSYFLIGWWLDRPQHWRLFYQPLASEDGGAGGGLVVDGLFWPWGKEPGGDRPADGGAALVVGDGVEVRLPEIGEFRNLFESLPTEFAFQGPVDRVAAGAGNDPAGGPFELGVRLIEETPHRRPTNSQDELKRLRRKIHQLEEQAATLDWWIEEAAPPVEMMIYRETESWRESRGTHWDLRAWFVSAPDQDIRKLHHQRVVVESLGALHLIVPAHFEHPQIVNLPPPAFRLRLDPRWRQFGRRLFVDDRYRLYPPPPQSNRNLVDILAQALWGESASADEALVILNLGERVHRFLVDGFAPLATRIRELNLQVAIERGRRLEGEEKRDGLEQVVERVHGELLDGLESHAAAMREQLDALWGAGGVADLDRYRQQVKEALDRVQAQRVRIREIDAWRDEIRGFHDQDRRTWESFRREVLTFDRQLLPSSRRQEVRAVLDSLDALREVVGSLWDDDKVAARWRTLKARLDDLDRALREKGIR
ncbi:MAG: hypothetical protein V3T72_13035 [Thermoanaerobaculia bacterium]